MRRLYPTQGIFRSFRVLLFDLVVVLLMVGGLRGEQNAAPAKPAEAPTAPQQAVVTSDTQGNAPETGDGDESGGSGELETSDARALRLVVEKIRDEQRPMLEKLQAEVDSILKGPVPEDAAGQKKWREHLRKALDAQRKAIDRAERDLRAALEKRNAELHPNQAKEL